MQNIEKQDCQKVRGVLRIRVLVISFSVVADKKSELHSSMFAPHSHFSPSVWADNSMRASACPCTPPFVGTQGQRKNMRL